VGDTQPTDSELVSSEALVQTSEHDADLAPESAEPEAAPQPTATSQPQPQASPQTTPAPQPTAGQLPVSGQGQDDSINPIKIMGVILVLVLLTGAITTLRRRRVVE
jgi:hypothetical protein